MEPSNAEEIPTNKNEQTFQFDDDFIKSILCQINSFRLHPESFLNRILERNKDEFKKFITSLGPMNELKLNQELCSISKEEVIKYSKSSEYNVIQKLPEEFSFQISSKFNPNNVILLGIEGLNKADN